jgi:hypothetical protein
MKLEYLEDLTVGCIYMVDFAPCGMGIDIIIKKSIGCRLIATRDDQDAQSEIVTRKNCDYDLYGVQTHNYIITEINETDLFAELL